MGALGRLVEVPDGKTPALKLETTRRSEWGAQTLQGLLLMLRSPLFFVKTHTITAPEMRNLPVPL